MRTAAMTARGALPRCVAVIVLAVATVIGGFVAAQPAGAAEAPHAIEVSAVSAAAAVPMGEDCSWACGRVNNLTGHFLDISRNYTDAGGCVGPYGTLLPGENSSMYWKDTDCVKSQFCRIGAGSIVPQNTWKKISGFLYDVRCV